MLRRRCNSIKALPSRLPPPRFFPLCYFFFFLFYRPLFPTLSEEADKIIYDSSYHPPRSMASNESKGLPHGSFFFFLFFNFSSSKRSFRGIVFNVKKKKDVLNGVKRPERINDKLTYFHAFHLDAKFPPVINDDSTITWKGLRDF